MINNLSKITVGPNTKILEVMAVIDSAAIQIAFVIDDSGILIATVTDGDIRRGLLHGIGLDMPVSKVMNENPTTLKEDTSEKNRRAFSVQSGFQQIPIVNSQGRLVDIMLSTSSIKKTTRSTRVVLMAGGLGTRLRPLTDNTPKPMIPIAGKPLLERIIQKFKSDGFQHFTLSINYLGHIIQNYFGNGKGLSVKIGYVEEVRRMGTAGALSLIKDRPKEPFIAMNGDILTTMSFGELMDFHVDTSSAVTMCARKFKMQVPYGVLNTDGIDLLSMEEKPNSTYLINAGIYVLSPIVFDYIREGEPLDMPDLIERVKKAGKKVSVFTVNEYWVDIGRIEDFERANEEYFAVFDE